MIFTKNKDLQKKLETLSKKKQDKIMFEYKELKREISTGRLLAILGRHYVHIKKYGLFVLYIITNFIYIGRIRYIIQFFYVKSNIEEYNDNVLELLYNRYE